MKIEKPYVVQREWMYGYFDDLKGFDTWDEAFQWMCKSFDASNGEDDYRIQEPDHFARRYPAHTLMLVNCPVCGKAKRARDFSWTYDCHGIQMRLVCGKCRDELMSKGYDGEYYTAADETFDEDW